MSQSRDYAEEVYAACATIGFDEGPAATLKALLDRIASRQDVSEAELLRVAQDAHLLPQRTGPAAEGWPGSMKERR